MVDMETVAMLLREPMCYVHDHERLCKDTDIAFRWYESMVNVSKQAGLPLGHLCRLVLPFDTNTDARDQSNVQNVTPLYDNDEMNGHVAELRKGAIFVRKMLRVKLADEADIRQVKEAIGMITTLVGKPNPN